MAAPETLNDLLQILIGGISWRDPSERDRWSAAVARDFAAPPDPEATKDAEIARLRAELDAARATEAPATEPTADPRDEEIATLEAELAAAGGGTATFPAS